MWPEYLHCFLVQIICLNFRLSEMLHSQTLCKEIGQTWPKPIKTFFFLCHIFWAIFFGELHEGLLWAGKERHKCGLVLFPLFSSLQTLSWYDSLSLARKDILGNFRVFCARTKGAWVQFATRVISTTQIPFFCAGKGGDTWSPLGLEDLQTDNSVQTSLKNITSVEQPQGWDQGFERAPSAAFLLLFALNKACLTMLKTPSFFGLNPLCRKSMQMLNVASLSEAPLIQLCFLCLALGADHPLQDAETSLPIQHPSQPRQSAPWA